MICCSAAAAAVAAVTALLPPPPPPTHRECKMAHILKVSALLLATYMLVVAIAAPAVDAASQPSAEHAELNVVGSMDARMTSTAVDRLRRLHAAATVVGSKDIPMRGKIGGLHGGRRLHAAATVVGSRDVPNRAVGSQMGRRLHA